MNVEEQFQNITEYFSPKVIGEVNDVYIKLAKIKGEDIPWHNHENEDEMFFIIDGEMLFEVENEPPFTMKKGDIFIVKKGINHRVSSKKECKIMLIENKTTAHTGDIVSKVTKSIEEQLK
ncbi:MAG: cupin domain-containing protein [Saprospiraceae bacterium]|nr:cupin domain-containing protein [Bacteroidia bacterium]NNL92213.1 cupin domain-containing protein [Saprospiraceae bacterium]